MPIPASHPDTLCLVERGEHHGRGRRIRNVSTDLPAHAFGTVEDDEPMRPEVEQPRSTGQKTASRVHGPASYPLTPVPLRHQEQSIPRTFWGASNAAGFGCYSPAMRPELTERWLTPDGLHRRERLIASGFQGAWREVLKGFPGADSLGPQVGDLRGIDLAQVELPGAELVHVRLDGARLDDSGLGEARLDFATLSGASLSWTRLERASLMACVAIDTCWDDASLEGAVLTASNLVRGSFRRARLQGARLTAATLMKADLRCANLRGAELSCCDMEEACVAGVLSDRPRSYARAGLGNADVRYYQEYGGYPSFMDALLLDPGPRALRWLDRRELLLHVEAAVEMSPGVDAEILALFRETHPIFHKLAVVAMLISGARPETLAALWGLIDRGSGACPQLTVAALLLDPCFEAAARSRLKAPDGLRHEAASSLMWALGLDQSNNVRGRSGESICQRWMANLRKHMAASIQQRWRRAEVSVYSA
ncbi:pentapeptide repeat-containing protein [Corallococcus sp. CA054B]|nr:pentapeptide repeat-containing protein [Corallococcus sp. CA054B]